MDNRPLKSASILFIKSIKSDKCVFSKRKSPRKAKLNLTLFMIFEQKLCVAASLIGAVHCLPRRGLRDCLVGCRKILIVGKLSHLLPAFLHFSAAEILPLIAYVKTFVLRQLIGVNIFAVFVRFKIVILLVCHFLFSLNTRFPVF